MGRIVDLTAKPYNLSEEQIQWVESTLASMTAEEKVGQLFTNLFFFGKDAFSGNDLTNKQILEKYHIGGARFHGGDSKQIQELLNQLQTDSKIPLLIAANCDSGGNGACSDGTYIASGAHCEASKDTTVAFNAGLVSAREASALGVNVNFDPCVDILYNWRNTIVNTRAYGTNADDVIKYTSAFIEGYRSERDMITCIKHFPGDGTEERDQHLVLGVNELSPEEWDNSFGRVYSTHIENGVEMIMAGHIALPEYQKKLNPSLEDKDILPATLAEELIQGLLKEQLGFNGMVITDASHMLGMTSAMRREDYVPAAIAAGCDMFLFFNDPDEDTQYMLEGYKNGTITEERLKDANYHILGMKAMLGLHKKEKTAIMPSKEGLSVIKCEEHVKVSEEVSDKAITLVKNLQKDILPITPEKFKRVLLVPQTGVPVLFDFSRGKKAHEVLKELLEAQGFEVTIFESLRDKLATLPPEEKAQAVMNVYASKSSINSFVEKYDLVIHVADVSGMMQPVQRIIWGTTKGTHDIPWYVHEVPTIFVSVCCPFHLADVPQVKTYINCYDKQESTMKALAEKLVGNSEFTGVSPVDAFCGYPDTRL